MQLKLESVPSGDHIKCTPTVNVKQHAEFDPDVRGYVRADKNFHLECNVWMTVSRMPTLAVHREVVRL